MMVLNQVDPKPMSEDLDNFTSYTAPTPPETVTADLLDDLDPLSDDKPSSSAVPWPGSTFIIRSASTGDVITLRDGQIVLDQSGGRGSTHWACLENKGWLAFQNPVSGTFLGHDLGGRLCCVAVRPQGWENFCVRLRPEGGYILLMTHYDKLWQVGTKLEQGRRRLAKVENGKIDGITWEFVKV
jgi:hypothetical protein